jgi:hypothetical protein
LRRELTTIGLIHAIWRFYQTTPWDKIAPEADVLTGIDKAHNARLIEFIDRSQIPIFTINVLQALPKTPLWDRLAREDRLIADPDQDRM